MPYRIIHNQHEKYYWLSTTVNALFTYKFLITTPTQIQYWCKNHIHTTYRITSYSIYNVITKARNSFELWFRAVQNILQWLDKEKEKVTFLNIKGNVKIISSLLSGRKNKLGSSLMNVRFYQAIQKTLIDMTEYFS